MTQSVRDVIDNAKVDYAEQVRHEWVTQWPGQVVLAVTQMFWTSEVQDAIAAGGSEKLAQYGTKLQARDLNFARNLDFDA